MKKEKKIKEKTLEEMENEGGGIMGADTFAEPDDNNNPADNAEAKHTSEELTKKEFKKLHKKEKLDEQKKIDPVTGTVQLGENSLDDPTGDYSSTFKEKDY